MSTQILEQTTTTTDGSEFELDHIFCTCNPNLAICGKDITDEIDLSIFLEWEDYTDDTCIVCMELDKANHPCENCGFTYDD